MARFAQRITIGQRAAVCALMIAGVPYSTSTKIVGAPYERMRRLMPPGWNDFRREPRRWKGALLERAREAYADAPTVADAANSVGCSRTQLQYLATAHGWPPRKRRKRRHGELSTLTPEQKRLYRKMRRFMPRAEALAGALA